MKFVKLLELEKKKDYYIKLISFLDKEYENNLVYPKRDDIFNCFKYTDIDSCKVVILGQDPYHEVNQANGLAFSVNDNVKLPPSLKNIFKEIENEYSIKHTSGDLTYLAKQGVLLLNTILTVVEGKPLSHQNKGWEILTDRIIEELNNDEHPKVFILLGNNAIKYKDKITSKSHLVLTAAHPSPLSAYHGFFNSNIFKKCNGFLRENRLDEIKW